MIDVHTHLQVKMRHTRIRTTAEKHLGAPILSRKYNCIHSLVNGTQQTKGLQKNPKELIGKHCNPNSCARAKRLVDEFTEIVPRPNWSRASIMIAPAYWASRNYRETAPPWKCVMSHSTTVGYFSGFGCRNVCQLFFNESDFSQEPNFDWIQTVEV